MYIYVYAVYLCTLCEILVLLVYMLFIYVYGVRIGIVMSYILMCIEYDNYSNPQYQVVFFTQG